MPKATTDESDSPIVEATAHGAGETVSSAEVDSSSTGRGSAGRAEGNDQPENAARPEDHDADTPSDISGQGVKAVAKRVAKQMKSDHVTLTAAGVAFYGFLAIIPGLVAVVTVYGLVGDPDTVTERVQDMAGTLPEEARALIIEQLEGITGSASSALTIGLIVSIGGALWAASSGMSHLLEAITIVYNQDEKRNFFKLRALALVLTLGAIVFVLVAIFAIGAWPVIVGAFDLPGTVTWLLRLAVWPVLALGLMAALAVLYKVGPNREDPEWHWASWGAGIAVVLWLIASIGFQVYVSNFGSYNETYGSLGAIVVLLMWLWISSLVTLIGAEINSELEYETAEDTTTGPKEPMGERGAHVADHVAPGD